MLCVTMFLIRMTTTTSRPVRIILCQLHPQPEQLTSTTTRPCAIGCNPVSGDLLFKLVADHGPWVLLVFVLLWRDAEKERATRAVLEKNATILTELGTIIRERMPRN